MKSLFFTTFQKAAESARFSCIRIIFAELFLFDQTAIVVKMVIFLVSVLAVDILPLMMVDHDGSRHEYAKKYYYQQKYYQYVCHDCVGCLELSVFRFRFVESLVFGVLALKFRNNRLHPRHNLHIVA